MHIVCPSGLAGEIRKLKVKEENYLADARAVRSGSSINKILASIWVETTDTGPYPIPDNGIPKWSKVLMGDHFYAMIMMRVCTYGPWFAFKQQCSNTFCRERFEWEVDLTKLDVQKLSSESKQIYASGNKFEYILDGQKVVFKLLHSDISKKYRRIHAEQRDRMATASLRAQIVEVEGIKDKDLDDWIDDLDSDQASDLRQAFDDAGCGVETEIEIECPHCDNIFSVNLPFGSRDFFSKSYRDKKARKEISKDSSMSSQQ